MSLFKQAHSSVLDHVDVLNKFHIFVSNDDNIPVVLYTGPAELYSDDLVNTMLQELELIEFVCLVVRVHPGVLMDNGGLFIEMPFVRHKNGKIVPYGDRWTLISRRFVEDRIGPIDQRIFDQLHANNPARQTYNMLDINIWRV